MKNTTVWVIFIVTAVKISKPYIYSKCMTQQDVRGILFISNIQSKVHSFYSLMQYKFM